jgi:hypothetical protein
MIHRRQLMMAVLSASLLLGGCRHFAGGGNCNKPQVYANAGDLPPLKIPVGLDGPDTRSALRVPELNEPEVPRNAKDPCLDEPPPIATSPAPAAR